VKLSPGDGYLTVARARYLTRKKIAEYLVGEKVSVCIRPEDIVISATKTSTSARNYFAGTIKRVSFGALTRLHIDCGFPPVVPESMLS